MYKKAGILNNANTFFEQIQLFWKNSRPKFGVFWKKKVNFLRNFPNQENVTNLLKKVYKKAGILNNANTFFEQIQLFWKNSRPKFGVFWKKNWTFFKWEETQLLSKTHVEQNIPVVAGRFVNFFHKLP